MKTLAIRELSATSIQAAAVAGDIIGITNDRTLAAVLYPISRNLTATLVENNLSRLVRNIDRGEHELRTAATSSSDVDFPTLEEVIEQPPQPPIDLHRARRVSIRDISGKVLSEAASANQAIALTSDRVVAGVILPVREDWVNSLIEQNLSRLLSSIEAGERELASGEELTTLDDEV